MHWVDRGTAPPALTDVQATYTPAWVAYYPNCTGSRPTDDRWRAFQPLLSSRFHALCGYCEEICNGQVDHFHPKSKFPSRVYEWSNWVLACPFCNAGGKGEKWPTVGYVDPCAEPPAERPETYFIFDTKTGELLPRVGLSARRRKRAERMRDDLKLNHFTHLKSRVQWLHVVRLAVQSADPADADVRAWITRVTARDAELSSLTRQYLAELRLI